MKERQKLFLASPSVDFNPQATNFSLLRVNPTVNLEGFSYFSVLLKLPFQKS